MSAISLEELGFTKEQLQDRVIERICEQLLETTEFNPYSEEEEPAASSFKKSIDKMILTRIDETIASLAEKHVLPNVTQYIEDLTIQKTNQYGEKMRGERYTFIEYLGKRAEDYMKEPVSYEGKSKGESNGYSWNGTQTRITFLIEKHLHYSIETAMKNALNVAVGEIANGIHETARLKLNEIAAGLKVQVSTK